MPISSASRSYVACSLWKKPNFPFLPAADEACGYFTMLAIVEYVITNPPGLLPLNWCVSSLKAFALPSKCVMSSQNASDTCPRSPLPAPSVKNVCTAFSPLCPKGGFPRSCARHAVATICPICSTSESFSSGLFLTSSCATSLPSDIPTLATSSECVSLLCTKMLPGSGNTCVLFCSRRNGAEKISLS